ncbi:MAG TPA: hypothetical protein VK673_07840 [Chthoniobacterales bacterium]|nr:hypothetical protein [Chthoniobacterales bacterium]
MPWKIAHGVPGWRLAFGVWRLAGSGWPGGFERAMLLQVLCNIFNLLGLGSFYQMTVTGVIIVLAILLNRWIDLRRIKH